MKSIDFLKKNNVDINKSLELFGDIETYNSTLNEFKKSIDEKLEKIRTSFKSEDMSNYAIYVHSLKSDCKYFGFLKLASLALEHEVNSKENNMDYVKENYQNLIDEILKVKNIVIEYLEDEPDTLNDSNSLRENIILIADDSEVIRLFVKKIFNNDYAIEVAINGQETLDIIKKYEKTSNIKAILLDLNMPIVDGFTVLDYMKDKDLFKKMPVTIVSGDASSEAINKAFTYDIVDMLSKPFSEDKIKEVVQRTINSIAK